MFSREPAKLKTQVGTVFEIYHTVILNSKILKIAFLLVDSDDAIGFDCI